MHLCALKRQSTGVALGNLDIRESLLQILGGTTCLTLYFTNTALFVFYGIACLIRLIEFAALFATSEEHMCERQAVLDK